MNRANRSLSRRRALLLAPALLVAPLALAGCGDETTKTGTQTTTTPEQKQANNAMEDFMKDKKEKKKK